LRSLYYTVVLIILTSVLIFAQGGGYYGGGNGWYCNPDSLIDTTVTGTAIVDSTMMMTMYYIDVNNDGEGDFMLNFGPWWYEPDSSNASRPNNGDEITIQGGMWEETMYGIPMIVVYEINGEFWRDPFDPFWSGFGNHQHMGGHGGGCNYSWGWENDTLQTITIQGTTMVDSTFMMAMYYLDTDGNNTPDYFLNFGPPWYEPESGAQRPEDGEQIDIVGGLIDAGNFPMVIVYEINGQQWFDSTWFGNYFGGGWIHSNMTQAMQFHTPFDQEDWMQVNPGWHSGMMMPDSLFMRMLEVYPQDLPGLDTQNTFCGYEFGVFNPMGQNMMWQGGHCGNILQFNSSSDFQLHYSDVQLEGWNIDESTIKVKYYNYQSNSWVEVPNITLDPANNTVTLSSDDIQNYFVLTGDQVVTANNSQKEVPGKFILKQNYPNPFNPSTTIVFELKNDSHITLTIYNVLGQKLFNLVDGYLQSGVHKVVFDGKNLPSGIYFYRLKTGEHDKVMKMDLIK
jgi:Secretion system C-terminal sorting domain